MCTVYFTSREQAYDTGEVLVLGYIFRLEM